MRKILVAVDETVASRRAGELVENFFAGLDDVEITAVNVARTPTDVGPPVPYGTIFAWRWPFPIVYDQPAMDDSTERQRAKSETIAAAQAPAGADVDVVFGDPVEAICMAADDENADLIVVGSNDRNFLERLLGRSVSQELVRQSSRPVLVVR